MDTTGTGEGARTIAVVFGTYLAAALGYGSGFAKGAAIAAVTLVWIAERFTEEHRAALDVLGPGIRCHDHRDFDHTDVVFDKTASVLFVSDDLGRRVSWGAVAVVFSGVDDSTPDAIGTMSGRQDPFVGDDATAAQGAAEGPGDQVAESIIRFWDLFTADNAGFTSLFSRVSGQALKSNNGKLN